MSFINQYCDIKDSEKLVDIPEQGDDYDSIRREYSEMLKNQLAKGNNGLVKTKYITFGIEANNLKEAKMRIERIEADILANFKTFGVAAYPLNGIERLEILHKQFNSDSADKFKFEWKDIIKTGLSTKDYIAPTSFDFSDGKSFTMGGAIGAVSYLQILAPELTDRMLADFLDMDTVVAVNIHIQSIDQSEAIKMIKRKLSDLDKMRIDEQKKAVKAGYDMDIIPSDLATYGNEAKNLLTDLQSRNERMFLVTFLVMNTAKTRQKLENNVFAASGIAQKYNCALKRLNWQQEQGLMSSLPLGLNQIKIQRSLTTSSTAIFVPFTTQELFMKGEALYYGLNALSNNLIMVNRKELKNPNGLFLGTPGSGKSFAAKREIINVFLITQDDIIIKGAIAQSAVLSLFKRLPNMSTNLLSMPVLSVLPMAYWVQGGDTGLKQTSKVAWEKKYIYAEELAVIVPIAEATLNDAMGSGYNIWNEISPLIQQAFGQRIDEAIIFGVNKPSNFRASIVDTAIATGNAVANTGDLYQDVFGEDGVISAVELSGFIPNGVISDVGLRGKLRGLVDATNRPLFTQSMKDSAAPYTLDGMPLFNIVNGAWDGTNASLIIGAMNEAVYSIRQDITFKILTESTITDGDGVVVFNLAQMDMVALRCVMRLGWEIPNPINALQPNNNHRSPFAILQPVNGNGNENEGEGGGL